MPDPFLVESVIINALNKSVDKEHSGLKRNAQSVKELPCGSRHPAVNNSSIAGSSSKKSCDGNLSAGKRSAPSVRKQAKSNKAERIHAAKACETSLPIPSVNCATAPAIVRAQPAASLECAIVPSSSSSSSGSTAASINYLVNYQYIDGGMEMTKNNQSGQGTSIVPGRSSFELINNNAQGNATGWSENINPAFPQPDDAISIEAILNGVEVLHGKSGDQRTTVTCSSKDQLERDNLKWSLKDSQRQASDQTELVETLKLELDHWKTTCQNETNAQLQKMKILQKVRQRQWQQKVLLHKLLFLQRLAIEEDIMQNKNSIGLFCSTLKELENLIALYKE